MLLHGALEQEWGEEAPPKYKFLFKLTQLMKYLSFRGLDNKFPPKYSPYFVFKAISFKI